jgi:hypothetical protein
MILVGLGGLSELLAAGEAAKTGFLVRERTVIKNLLRAGKSSSKSLNCRKIP